MDCAAHPGQPIIATCTRCGGFVCALDVKQADGKPFCADCAARQTDWLAAFKAELWGKRDDFAWFYGGLGTFVNGGTVVVLAGLIARSPSIPFALVAVLVLALVNLGVDLAYFLGRPAARVAVIVLPIVWWILIAASGESVDAWSGGGTVISFLTGLSAWGTTRNKLFFKVDVTDEELRKLWDKTRNNQIAETGFAFGVLGMLVPLFAVPGMICSLIALSRVNPDAVPPIGKRGRAIAGIICSGIGLVWGILFFAFVILGR